jgi:Glycosyl transferase family 11
MVRRVTVVVRLAGGLGNQMFQYATARAVAVRTGQDLVLDLATADSFLLDIFELGRYRWLTPGAAVRVGLPPWRSRRGTRVSARLSAARHLKAATFGTFLPDVLEVSGSVVLWGHWQSEQYFADARDLIVDEFTTLTLSPAAIQTVGKMRSTSSVGISFRRGDYLTAVPQEDLPAEDFYLMAYQNLCGSLGHAPHVYGFSDDRVWLAENLGRLFPGATQVSGRVSQTPADEITLHAATRHQIIPPSSFSWWAAWLNPYEHKRVLVPRRWVWDWAAPDVVPDSWERI